MWYKVHFTKEKMLKATWAEFEKRSDAYFISSAAKANKEAELIDLQQGDLLVEEYEDKFVSLCHLTDLFQNPESQARMFERRLRMRLHHIVITQRFPTLREVADAALALECDIARAKSLLPRQASQQRKGRARDPLQLFRERRECHREHHRLES